MDFSWDQAGLIDVVASFVAIPDVALVLGSNSTDQTILAAFVLLVLLTAGQASFLMYSIFYKVRQASSIFKALQVSLLVGVQFSSLLLPSILLVTLQLGSSSYIVKHSRASTLTLISDALALLHASITYNFDRHL